MHLTKAGDFEFVAGVGARVSEIVACRGQLGLSQRRSHRYAVFVAVTA